MMYLIPKNIKVKREIFKGIGIIEIVVLAISFGIGFLLQSFVVKFNLKIFLFFLFPLLIFLLILPLPNGSSVLVILKRFIIYQYKQKKYRM